MAKKTVAKKTVAKKVTKTTKAAKAAKVTKAKKSTKKVVAAPAPAATNAAIRNNPVGIPGTTPINKSTPDTGSQAREILICLPI